MPCFVSCVTVAAASTIRTQPRSTALSQGAATVPMTAGHPITGRLPLPARLLILPWGESKDLSGRPVICNQVTLADLATNQAAHGFEEIALDFNHSTVDTKQEKEEGKPKFVAGYGTLSVVENEGVYFTPTSWTPEGEAAYTGRHYRDLSPTVGRNEKGEVTFIHSVALCRQGQIPNLTAYSAVTPLAIETTPTTTTHSSTMPDYRSLLIKILKLADDATDEAIVAAVDSAKTETETEIKTTTPETTPMSADQVTIARLDRIEKNMIVENATRAGKVIPLSAAEIATTPLETLRSICDRIQPTVPLSASTPAPGSTATAPATTALSAEEKLICQNLGISEADYLKNR